MPFRPGFRYGKKTYKLGGLIDLSTCTMPTPASAFEIINQRANMWNGATDVVNSLCGYINNHETCFITLQFPAPKRIARMEIFGSNSQGYVMNSNPVVGIGLFGHTVPGSPVTGLGEVQFTDTTNQNVAKVVDVPPELMEVLMFSFYVQLYKPNSTTDCDWRVAELKIYEAI